MRLCGRPERPAAPDEATSEIEGRLATVLGEGRGAVARRAYVPVADRHHDAVLAEFACAEARRERFGAADPRLA
jgi:hypothetical protein